MHATQGVARYRSLCPGLFWDAPSGLNEEPFSELHKHEDEGEHEHKRENEREHKDERERENDNDFGD